MSELAKIVWAEGVMLSQQHLQYWESYQEAKQLMLYKLVQPHAWGIIHYKVDSQSLALGDFRLLSCKLLLPNGVLIEAAAEQSYLQLNLRENANTEMDVYLVQADGQHCSNIPGYIAEKGSSWQAKFINIQDQYDNQRSNQVLIAEPNLQLAYQVHAGNENSIKLASIKRNQYGEYHFTESFVPSILQVKQSPVLIEYIKHYLSLCYAKYQELKTSKEVITKLLLSHIGQAILYLQDVQAEANVHPHDLYRNLTDLIGRLSVFDESFDIKSVPSYQHNDLTSTFVQLNAVVMQMLQISLASRQADIHFNRQSENVFVSDRIEADILREYDFFIGVKYTAESSSWIDDFIRYAKLGASDMIETIVASALPGIMLRNLQHLPNNFPNKPGFQYFHIQTQGDYWEQVLQEQKLSLFLAQQFETADVELLVLQRS